MSITSYNAAWFNIKQKMLEGLYNQQILHWNMALKKLIQKNANLQGIVLSEAQCAYAAIQHKHITWKILPLNWMDTEDPTTHHFNLCEGQEDMEKELDSITTELAKIKKERYESDRFMSSLGVHTLKPNKLKEVFGENLYSLISSACVSLPVATIDALESEDLIAFLNMHSRILDHMQERVLVNMLMSEIFQ